MRFYLGEDLSDVIAQIGRDRFGLDIVDARSMGMEHAPDDEQIVFAARERRCIVTRNGDDFAILTRYCAAEGLPHSGVVVVPNSLTGKEFMHIARGLARLHELYPNDVYPYLALYLPHVDPDDAV